MNVWCTFSTIFNQRRVLQIAGLLTLCVALITMLFLGSIANAAPGVNQTVSFQARLLTPQGQPVADGYYNVQFKIYQDGTGTAAGNPGGTLEWTETYVNNGGNNAVFVKNGYLSVNLGSLNPFGTQVDWNQDTLWLSMNIAGSSTLCETFGTAPCLADGEMLPMKRLTAAPYALNSGKVGGKSADELIHNGTSQQTGNFNISGTGTANVLQGSTGVISPLLDRADAGTLSIGSANATGIVIGSNASNQTIEIGTNMAQGEVVIGAKANNSGVVLQGGTTLGVHVETVGGFRVYNDNTDLVSFSMSAEGTFRFRLAGENTLMIRDGNDQGVATFTSDGSLSLNNTLSAGADVWANGSIGAISADEQNAAGVSWLDGNSTAYMLSTGNTLALQGAGVDLLTAKNTTGKATIGIGNAASSGYALDVTGEINASTTYKINGVDVLGSNDIAFSGATGSGLSSSNGDGLRLFSNDGIKIGDSTTSSSPTLLTLDKGTAAPGATGDAVLGSMYYDTTLGKVQCYEADGWGSCSSSPDNFINLSPEYTNAVTSENASGEFTSGFCSDGLNLNDANNGQPICNTNETYNYYEWHSPDQTETKDIFVTYQLPSNFTGFVDDSLSLTGRTLDTMASVEYTVYKSTSTGLVACGSTVSVADGSSNNWNKAVATGSADPASCNFAASDSLVVRISLTAVGMDSYAYASNLSFAFSDQ